MDSEEINTPQTVPVKSKRKSYLIKAIAIFFVIIISYSAGYQTGHKGFVFVPKDFKVVNQKDTLGTVDYSLLWKAIDVLNNKYIDKPVDQQKILYGAVSGAIAAAGDPYTTFFAPDDLKNFQTGLQGSFGGIGAEVGKKDGNIVIIAPLDGTPAKRAGILSGDIIVKVDGQSTQDWSADQAVNKIRGTKGTSVTLTLLRSGKDQTFDLKIVRDTIVIKSVKLEYKDVVVDGQKKSIAVITISEFGDDTKALFDQAVANILVHNVSGVIVDLRNNPGGYLQTAVDLASAWVKQDDLVVSEAHSDGTNVKYTAEGNPRLAGLKTIVMINGGSASAAEILSGALHDHGFAKLLGEKSFGKGSVQELVSLPGETAVKVTVAKWITPNGVNLNHNGLDPDIQVKLTADDVTAGKDPQMDKALEQFVK